MTAGTPTWPSPHRDVAPPRTFVATPRKASFTAWCKSTLETCKALACEEDWGGHAVPAFVEREFRRYLDCGILAKGFARAQCPDCGHDFLVAFSCKGRGLCRSCNARRMAENAAVEAHLHQRIPGASPRARLGAISFVHRFGAALNRHVHYNENHPGSRASRALPGAQIRSRRIGHCCILGGLFEPLADGRVRFFHAPALAPEDIAVIGEEVRRRMLRWFARSGLLKAENARDMLGWDNGGFSLDAAVRIAGRDRVELERLLCYCARPAFALERLEQVNAHQVVYHLPKPLRTRRLQPGNRRRLYVH